MSSLIKHPYHLVNDSPWPMMSAVGAVGVTSGFLLWFHYHSSLLLIMGLMTLVLVSFQWWRDVKRESAFQGLHTKEVQLNMRWGMLLFISSEALFFTSFFWAFLHSSLSPDIALGVQWPPNGITPFNPLEIPLLNTMVLLSSGVTVTWAHHSVMGNNHSASFKSLLITVILGVYFTLLQAMEYYESPFTFSDSIYGSTFFLTTGFHGVHVIIGTLFLFTILTRLNKGELSGEHHFGFEAAAWYWHFVDVIWLLLYILIYWWGGV
uniref:cytochrome c oxidase subunit III n=1 Tax=Lamproglena chinensis TaxID=342427 RepID=UPI00286AAEA1|nr:cytochrome c oxidase subunit III [Lamproglena chinensis]WKF18932.1 cytochrome c oxidase subunit 3 [Lamproglena chinensis]